MKVYINNFLLCLAIQVFVINLTYSQSLGLTISHDFPGGNIIVERISNDTIWVKPDLRDTEGYWFYWYFRVEGAEGKNIRFEFPPKPVFSRLGPAYSVNNNQNWKWYGEHSYDDTGFTFKFGENDSIVYFSMGFPYTSRDFYQFVDDISPYGSIKLDTLTYSRKNRAVEELYIIPEKKVKHRVLISARNHSCEMMGSYVLEGIIKGIIKDKDLEYLRDHVEFRIIPFVDKDGVEDGDQGKNRLPRDHNRDYDDDSIYPEVRALMSEIPAWSQNKLRLNLDIHNPYIKGVGKDAEYVFLVGSEAKENEEEQLKFSYYIESNNFGEIKYHSENFMRFGTAWNKPNNNRKGPGNSRWGWTIPGVRLSTTIEFPYSYVSGIAVTKDNARVFGETLAIAVQEYLLSL